MTPNPIQIVDHLLSYSVPLVIIGGHAVNSYGYPRATEDTDIIFDRNVESESRLLAALESVNAFWISNEIDPATGIERTIRVNRSYVANTHLMMLGTDMGYLDIFDFIPGATGEPTSAAFQNIHLVAGRPYVQLRLLRQMKLAAGRTIDLLDLENLPSDPPSEST